jgi:hypothetical protein
MQGKFQVGSSDQLSVGLVSVCERGSRGLFQASVQALKWRLRKATENVSEDNHNSLCRNVFT